MLDPDAQRRFATDVVRRLRAAGFVAYWAGGCVRDRLLGREAKDYDVATSATPNEIRRVFGYRRTLAIGAAFGVITVVGPKAAGQVEVTTFRQDAAYSDGRHPDRVTFTSAEEDASRRDFTINGLFFDPIAEEILDYVGGREDLDRAVVRAIGDPGRRFDEDKLRMVRAVRFSAAFGFAIEPETWAALGQMALQITVVSPERIAMEMRRILVLPQRTEAVRLLVASGLADALLPEIVPGDEAGRERLVHILVVLDRLDQPSFPLALGTLLHAVVDADGAREVGRRWRLSNHETDRTAWLVAHQAALREAPTMAHSSLQPLLVADGIEDLLALHAARWPDETDAAAFCRALLAQPRDRLDPPPLITGDDLVTHGLTPGAAFRTLLSRVRDAQLDGQIATSEEALALIDQIRAEKP